MLNPSKTRHNTIPGSGLPDQVSELIIRFPRVKPLAGPDQTDMESWWLTPFRTEIFRNPKGVCHYRLRPIDYK